MSHWQLWSLVAVGLGVIVCMVWRTIAIQRQLDREPTAKRSGRFVKICDACSIAWELDDGESLADDKCLQCTRVVRREWCSLPSVKHKYEVDHVVKASAYKANELRDMLYCLKCHTAHVGVGDKDVDAERAEMFRAMRCPCVECGGLLRKPLPGEWFGLEMLAYRRPSIFSRFRPRMPAKTKPS